MVWFLFIAATIIAALTYVVAMIAWKEIKYHRNRTGRLQ